MDVGLVVDSESATIGGGSAIDLVAAPGGWSIRLAAGAPARVTARRNEVVVGGSPRGNTLDIHSTGQGSIRVNGRDYRGRVRISAEGGELTVVNTLTLDEYLVGVVAAELGRRPVSDWEAVAAQAIVSRTYALRSRGRWREEGFDVRATVSDQVYGGVGAEDPVASEAVAATAGLAITWNGKPIDAFFFSTCGGHTERGTEVFRGADGPYLRGGSDLAPDGTAYCSLSPRYRWREEFTGDALRQALRRYLPAAVGTPPARVTRIRDVAITSRTESGRARTLAVALPGSTVDVPSNQIRSVLRPASGEILRSTLIQLGVRRDGDEVTHLVVEGSGNGHGVGFCQWGAMGRARAGQSYAEIIEAYYPGTRIERVY